MWVHTLTKRSDKKLAGENILNFGKLLPKDRILAEEDNRLEIVIRNGKTFWLPVSESVNIHSQIMKMT